MIIMPVVCKFISIETIKAAKVSSYPKYVFMINQQTYNYVTAQAVFIVGIVQVLFERIVFPVKINQSSTIGSNPDIT